MKTLLLVFLLLIPSISFAAITNTTTGGETGTLGIYKQVVSVATAADDIQCVDARGYDWITVQVDISGTINVDLDRSVASTGAIPEDWSVDITADKTVTEAVKAPYYCYDIDSCTTCGLTATFYLVSKKPF